MMMRRYIRICEYVFAFLSLFFFTGGVTTTLTPAGSNEAPIVQLIGILIGVISFGLLMLKPRTANRALVLYWPALIIPVFALFSVLWSVDLSLTIRRSGSLLLTTVFALWLVERFDQKAIFNLVMAAFIALSLDCWFYIIAIPAKGIHQANDLIGWEHAGSWRGVYFHKNDFGRAIALSTVMFAVGAAVHRKWVWAYVLLVVQALVMIKFSNSGQAVVLAVFPSAILLLTVWIRSKTVQVRTMIVAAVIPMAVMAYMLSNTLLGAVLEALGKDSTLTGRTEIWYGVIQAMANNFLVGGGFGAGWDLVGDRVIALTAIEVGHAHNGYLDLMTDLGIVGLIMVFVFAAQTAIMAFRAVFYSPSWIFGAMAFGYMAFYFIGNWAGSFLLLHNSIYWVMLIAGFASLRNLFNPYARRTEVQQSGQVAAPVR